MRRVNNDRINHVLASGRRYDLNCWGTTVYVLNKASRMHWANGRAMFNWLAKACMPVAKPRRGDILVMLDRSDSNRAWCDDPRSGITHTAVYLGRGRYFHKCGGDPARYDDEAGVLGSYDFTHKFHVRPVKRTAYEA